MKIPLLLIISAFTIQNNLNNSKPEIIQKIKKITPNVNFNKKWENNSGFGVYNMYSSVEYYNYKNTETAVVNFRNYNMQFTLIDKNNNCILIFYSSIDNIFTRYIGKFYTNIINQEIKNTNIVPPLINYYNNWLINYKN